MLPCQCRLFQPSLPFLYFWNLTRLRSPVQPLSFQRALKREDTRLECYFFIYHLLVCKYYFNYYFDIFYDENEVSANSVPAASHNTKNMLKTRWEREVSSPSVNLPNHSFHPSIMRKRPSKQTYASCRGPARVAEQAGRRKGAPGRAWTRRECTRGCDVASPVR